MHESPLSASQSGSVLIVEDEPKLGQLLVDYLQAAGYRTQWLTNGAEVVATVRQTPPAIILLDLMLPGSDGITLCREIRRFSDIPIVMVTAKRKRLIGYWGWRLALMTISASPIAHGKWSLGSKPFYAAALSNVINPPMTHHC